MYFPIRHLTLMKSGSLARDLVTCGDDYIIFLIHSYAESPPIGTLLAVPVRTTEGSRKASSSLEFSPV
jgi:hypothetical protein